MDIFKVMVKHKHPKATVKAMGEMCARKMAMRSFRMVNLDRFEGENVTREGKITINLNIIPSNLNSQLHYI